MLSAQRYTSIDETAFNEFDATYSGDSLTVTIDPGEAFVDGWLARDEPTDIDLAVDTSEQTIVLGWNPDAIYDDQQRDTRDEADQVILALESDADPVSPTVDIWTFETDTDGVTNAEDQRDIGPELSQNLAGRTAIDYRELVVDSPERLPITELDDGESIEIPVRIEDGETLEVYRWGAHSVNNTESTTGLNVELLDGADNIQVSANTADDFDSLTPVASYENTSGDIEVVKLRVKNDTGTLLDDPGVAAYFGYLVV
jgi:hypothetical protein